MVKKKRIRRYLRYLKHECGVKHIHAAIAANILFKKKEYVGAVAEYLREQGYLITYDNRVYIDDGYRDYVIIDMYCNGKSLYTFSEEE